MLQEVNLGARSLADYTHIVGRPLVEEIRALSEPLQGKRVLHLSATAFGGGVSEILYTLVPLMRDVGIDAHWQVILGRNGILNWLIPGEPIEWLLYSRFAVILTLSTTYITYTTIPIYAAMKAIEPSMFEAAVDLGAGWWQQARKILIPLAAPGIFIAMILVYIPMLTDFVTSDIVGGTSSPGGRLDVEIAGLTLREGRAISTSPNGSRGGAIYASNVDMTLLDVIVTASEAKGEPGQLAERGRDLVGAVARLLGDGGVLPRHDA